VCPPGSHALLKMGTTLGFREVILSRLGPTSFRRSHRRPNSTRRARRSGMDCGRRTEK
jgi:hypothetical protein